MESGQISAGPGTIIRSLEKGNEDLSILDEGLLQQHFSNSQKIMAAMLRKGGKQPNESSQGNRTFPNMDPTLPNIIRSETVIVLKC